MDRVVPLGWAVQNPDGFLIFDLEAYEMGENERRGERSRERTSSAVRLYYSTVPANSLDEKHSSLMSGQGCTTRLARTKSIRFSNF